ncbi:MAG: lipopolysaccharide heptosyltransferase II [Limisphaerales bacterium]
MKILILKPSSLGDVIQALPVLRLLKRHDPASEIHWWLGTGLISMLEGDPDLAGICPFDRRRWASPRYWHEMGRSIQRIREQRFDRVIDLQGLARSGLFGWCANAQLMIGLDDPREGAPAFYDLRIRRPSFHTHAVDWYLEVLRALDVPVHWDFTWLPCRPEVAAAVQQKWRLASHRWVVINPGGRWGNKRWPAEHYRELVARLAAEDPEMRFAILGSASDAALGERIVRGAPEQCLDLTGRTSLPEMIEWIRLSEAMVTNDTGPMHVAAALGKPIVAIFGPTDPRRTGPYRQEHRVLQLPLACAPCLRSTCHYEKPLECLVAITPETVCREVRRRLTESRSERVGLLNNPANGGVNSTSSRA